MQERDIDTVIKTFRNNQEIFLDDNTLEKHCFVNPIKETPVETSQFLCFRDLSWIDSILQKLFPRFQWIKHRLYSRVKLMMFQKLRPDLRKVAEVYRVLQVEEEIAQNLRFDPDDLPGYETIRHFINDLLDDETVKQVFYQEVETIDQELHRHSERLGEKT